MWKKWLQLFRPTFPHAQKYILNNSKCGKSGFSFWDRNSTFLAQRKKLTDACQQSLSHQPPRYVCTSNIVLLVDPQQTTTALDLTFSELVHTISMMIRGVSIPMMTMVAAILWPASRGHAFTVSSSVVGSIVPKDRISRPRQQPLFSASSSSTSIHGEEDEDDDDDDLFDDDNAAINQDEVSNQESDWIQAELTLRQAPTEPHPDLSPATVALSCARSLQWVDAPTISAGLARCFPFFTYECRKTVTARQGGESVERFQKYGLLSPNLQPFMGAHRVEVGEGSYTGAVPPLRGAMVSFPVRIQVAHVLAVQYPSGLARSGVAQPAPIHMVMRLEQQRRPPHQGCWLIREVLDVRHAFYR